MFVRNCTSKARSSAQVGDVMLVVPMFGPMFISVRE